MYTKYAIYKVKGPEDLVKEDCTIGQLYDIKNDVFQFQKYMKL